MDTSVVDCIFCSSPFRRGPKGEDVIPRWYAKAITHPRTGEVLIGFADMNDQVMLDPEPTQTVAARAFRIRDVCPNCNGGWMSRIENSAKEPLLDMMNGRRRLTSEEVSAVAKWAQLKAILWDYLQSPPRLAPAFRQEFRSNHPVRSMAVVVGRVDESTNMDIVFLRHRGTTRVGGTDVEMLRVTICFHQLLLQVTATLGQRVPVELFREACGQFHGIWPPRLDDQTMTPDLPPVDGIPLRRVTAYA